MLEGGAPLLDNKPQVKRKAADIISDSTKGQRPDRAKARESRSVRSPTGSSERDRWHQPCVPERVVSGDNEEYHDEVMAVNITPEHSGEPGHDVKTRRPAVERSGMRTRGGELDARLLITINRRTGSTSETRSTDLGSGATEHQTPDYSCIP